MGPSKLLPMAQARWFCSTYSASRSSMQTRRVARVGSALVATGGARRARPRSVFTTLTTKKPTAMAMAEKYRIQAAVR